MIRKYYKCSPTGSLSSPSLKDVKLVDSKLIYDFCCARLIGADSSMAVMLSDGTNILAIERSVHEDFVLAHEVGHVVLGSLYNLGNDECAADAYALMRTNRESIVNFLQYLESFIEEHSSANATKAIASLRKRARLIRDYLNKQDALKQAQAY